MLNNFKQFHCVRVLSKRKHSPVKWKPLQANACKIKSCPVTELQWLWELWQTVIIQSPSAITVICNINAAVTVSKHNSAHLAIIQKACHRSENRKTKKKKKNHTKTHRDINMCSNLDENKTGGSGQHDTAFAFCVTLAFGWWNKILTKIKMFGK